MLGKLVKFHDDRQRWEVKLENDKVIAVKEMNLQVVSYRQAFQNLALRFGKTLRDVTSEFTASADIKEFAGHLYKYMDKGESDEWYLCDYVRIRETFPDMYKMFVQIAGLRSK